MKLETLIIVIKMLVVTLGAGAMALVGSLSQWSNEASEPTRIQWIIIGASTVGASMTALGGFLSSAFGKYLDGRNGNGVDKIGQTTEPPKP